MCLGEKTRLPRGGTAVNLAFQLSCCRAWAIHFICLFATCSLLGACATGSQPATSESLRTVPAEQAFALPPPGGPSIVAVLERRYSNATQQEIALSTSARTTGQNFLQVRMFGPVNERLAGQSAISDTPLATANISRELKDHLPAVAMRRSPYYTQNRYGPFGYAVGRSRLGDLCLYGWQRIRPSGQTTLIRNKGTISLRLRLCDRTMSEDELLSVMYGISINAFFKDMTWNPYGEPPGPPENLGRTASPIYPNSPSGSATVSGPPTNIQATSRPATPVRPSARLQQPTSQPLGTVVPPPPVQTQPLGTPPVAPSSAVVPPPP
jgi:Cellulose biosynthesis protein BcsN